MARRSFLRGCQIWLENILPIPSPSTPACSGHVGFGGGTGMEEQTVYAVGSKDSPEPGVFTREDFTATEFLGQVHNLSKCTMEVLYEKR